MKRSAINKLIKEAMEFIKNTGFNLPPFAFWTPGDWKQKGHEVDEIRVNGLGWDVTDFGLNDFQKYGLLLFTIRNGNYFKSEIYPKKYSEKIMMVREEQVTPMHFHWKKREDIINRGGGNLVLEMYKSTEDEQLSDETFSVSIDGLLKNCSPGQKVELTPGESICLEPYIYHKFYGAKGKGDVLVGEVSDVNDDENDNRFIEVARFPKIEEDEEPMYLLCNEYPPV